MIHKDKKNKIIQHLKDLFSSNEFVFFISLKNLKVANLIDIRKEIKKIQAKILITKKTLIKIANKNLKDLLEDSLFKTPLALIFSNKNNDLEIINILNNLNKEINLEILGVYFDNKFYDKENIMPLSKFNNRTEIYAYLLSGLKNNLLKLSFVFKYPLIKLKTVVSNIKK
ncbi:MAG: hypothetical protein KatS3mg095_0021 [Candidatus Parcubacteria bacterium]|nr:MAG: hypothetical protein KatS3mg095_0021 [Candidatus Parcubacteria bacterium]